MGRLLARRPRPCIIDTRCVITRKGARYRAHQDRFDDGQRHLALMFTIAFATQTGWRAPTQRARTRRRTSRGVYSSVFVTRIRPEVATRDRWRLLAGPPIRLATPAAPASMLMPRDGFVESAIDTAFYIRGSRAQ